MKLGERARSITESLKGKVKGVKDNSLSAVQQKVIDQLALRLPKLLDTVSVNIPQETKNECRDILQDDKKMLLVVMSHQAHADGIAAMRIADELVETVDPFRPADNPHPGFNYIVASSLVEGDQSTFLKKGWDAASPILEDHHLHAVPITREKDIVKYGTRRILSSTRKLKSGIQKGIGIFLHAEGRVEAGRHEKGSFLDEVLERNTENIYGMQEFEQGALSRLVKLIEDGGKEAYILPVGIHGGFRIINPTKNWPTKNLLRAVFGKNNQALVDVQCGKPIRVENLRQRFLQEISSKEPNLTPEQKTKAFENALNEFIGKRVAELIPEYARGIHREQKEEIKEEIVYQYTQGDDTYPTSPDESLIP